MARTVYSREILLEILKKHNIVSIKDFETHAPAAYLWYCRHKSKVGELPLIRKKRQNWTKEECALEAKKYQYRKDFQDKSKGAYLAALTGGYLDEICPHMAKKPFKREYLHGKPNHRRIDLAGQRFGSWIVLEPSEQGKFPGMYWKCKCDCGTESNIVSQNLREGWSTKCAKCSNQVSKAQKEIYEFVKSLGFADAILSDESFRHELDIYVPSKKFAIEYDGLFWHSDWHQNRDKYSETRNKFKKVKDSGISCFRIFEDEYSRKPELVKEMIKSRLGIKATKVPESIEIRPIAEPLKYKDFFEKYHLDGYGKCNFAFGAFDGEKLISCLSFRKYIHGSNAGQLELARFCSNYNYNTYGLFSKILKTAKEHAKILGYKKLISASDNRYSSGNVYKNNGFVEQKDSDSRLNYYYIHQNRRIHRFQCKKLHPPQITEEQYAQFPTEEAQTRSGLTAEVLFGKNEPMFRIWGWGNKVWVLDL